MPRGLGDNPLKREKKTRRTASQQRPFSAADVSGSVSAASTAPIPDDAADASSSSRSYNDVFFHRRFESSPAANSTPEQVAVEESEPAPATAPIAAAEAAVAAPAVPEAITPSTSEPQPEIHLSAPEPILPIEAPAPEPAAVQEPVHVAEQVPSAEAAPQKEKSGFLGRILGKFRKS